MTGLCKTASDKYYAKCYCPGTDPALESVQFKELRDLMYVKRREYTNVSPGFPPVHYFPGKYNMNENYALKNIIKFHSQFPFYN